MTTTLRDKSDAPGIRSCAYFFFCLDVVDSVLDGLDLLGVFIGDVEVERFLKRHHQLDDVERVRAQVVHKRGALVDLALVDPKLFHNDLLYLLLQPT